MARELWRLELSARQRRRTISRCPSFRSRLAHYRSRLSGTGLEKPMPARTLSGILSGQQRRAPFVSPRSSLNNLTMVSAAQDLVIRKSSRQMFVVVDVPDYIRRTPILCQYLEVRQINNPPRHLDRRVSWHRAHCTSISKTWKSPKLTVPIPIYLVPQNRVTLLTVSAALKSDSPRSRPLCHRDSQSPRIVALHRFPILFTTLS